MGCDLGGSQKTVTFTLEQWHQRFQQQARWMETLRCHFLEKIHLTPDDLILEVGCGTGAITQRMHLHPQHRVMGLDLDLDRLIFAEEQAGDIPYVCANGMSLPFASNSFSFVYCHFYLLWVKDPRQAIREMARVSKNGGKIAFFSEPDYDARVDEPKYFKSIGRMQTTALQLQDADPAAGKKLSGWLAMPGISLIEAGIFEQGDSLSSIEEEQAEWVVTREDLRPFLSSSEIEHYLRMEKTSWEKKNRVRFVPTHFALAQVDK